MPTTPDSLDTVQVIKHESDAHGGEPGSSAVPYPEPIEVLEDMLEASGIYVVEVGRRNKALAIWSDNGNMRFRDVINPGVLNPSGEGTGFTLTELLAGTGGVTEASHLTLLQLIHFIDEGPAKGFISGATKTVTGTVFPTQILWKRQDGTKLVEKNITWTGVNPTTIEWKMYAADGTTVLETFTDTITYSGVFETGRTRA